MKLVVVDLCYPQAGGLVITAIPLVDLRRYSA